MSAAVSGECHPFRSAQARDRYLSRYDEAARSWPIRSETRMIPTEHGQTFVRIGGPSEAPPLVLLPGVWSSSLMWDRAIEALSERLRTYAVDNIVDFGRSVSSRPVTGTPDFMAWIDGLLDGLGLSEGVNLLGCSRGTWLAAEYVLHAPHRLAKAVWLSPAFVVNNPALGSAVGAPASLASILAPSPTTVGWQMSWLLPDFKQSDRHGFDEFTADTALGLQCFDTRHIGRVLGPRVFTNGELGGIDIPVLYLAGEKEKMSSVSAAVSRLNRVAPQIETAIIPGAGHDLVSVRTQAFTDRVLQFIEAQRGLTEPAGHDSAPVR